MQVTWKKRKTVAISLWCIMLMLLCIGIIFVCKVNQTAISYRIAVVLSIVGLLLSSYLVSFCTKCCAKHRNT